jgi:UPF0755 protein
MLKKVIIYGILLLFLIGGGIVFFFYDAIYSPYTEKQYELFIDESSSKESVTSELLENEVIPEVKSFKTVSKLMSFNRLKPGRYIINEGLTARQLISKLRAGRQDAVNLTFNNARLIDDLSGKLAKNIELDSLEILEFLRTSPLVAEAGYSQETLMSLFIPNTYKVYYNISPKDLFDRLQKEHDKFWTKERKLQAEKLGLTPKEVYTLASIVDKESLQKDEKPRIAGVYLNRIERGIPLEADPTVVFALKQFDLRRVLFKHLEYDSPYNTYKYLGLPPGPIGMSSISGIDAVLNREDHEFIFFCAKPNGKGRHAFAKTLAGHNRNARKYQQWLNSRGIR